MSGVQKELGMEVKVEEEKVVKERGRRRRRRTCGERTKETAPTC